MKKFLYSLLLGIAVLSMSSCSPFTLVNSETYNNADLASYHTFRIVTPDDDGANSLPDGMQMVTYYNIAAAIREQMIERGFVEDSESPLLINLGITVHREIQTAPAPMPPAPIGPAPVPGPYYNGYYPYFIYPRPYYWPNAQVITGIYKEGVLTMDMVNIQEKIPLYTASVATILENGQSQFRNLAGIAQAVETLFSRFPVPLLPQYQKK